jgi:hypothetical protein
MDVTCNASLKSFDGVSLHVTFLDSKETILINATAITAHWIDDAFRLQEALLAFKRLEGAHTGNYMA